MHIVLVYLFMLSGTILCFVFVVGVAIVVVVVVGGGVVVVDVVVAALFPLFLCNHAQDNLAHLEQRMTNMINNIGEIQTQSNIFLPPH